MQTPDHRPLPKTLLAVPGLLGLLLVHFTLVGLYVVPPNPISLQARPAIRAWLLPHFSQRWQLFAPEPAGINQYVHVRCHVVDEDGEHVTPWVDVTTPLVKEHHVNRLGSAGRMLRGMRPTLGLNQEVERRAVKHLDGQQATEALEALDEEAARQFERGKAHLQRIASAECKRRFVRPGVEVISVQARDVRAKIPPFGIRHDVDEIDAQAVTLPRMDYVEVSL
ncbi:MAG: DUF5819 family protein [Nannocystaceae bacterium]|nr:DUF5819 family protein [bacterium]